MVVSTLIGIDCDIAWSSEVLIISTDSKVKAKKLLHRFSTIIAEWAFRLRVESAIIKYPDGYYRIPAILNEDLRTMMDAKKLVIPNAPGIYIGEIGIYTTNLLNTLTELLTRKEADLGLVRVRDNLQIVLTQGASLSLGTEDINDCVRLKRSDYWHPADLVEFNRHWQQQLKDDGSNVIEYTYRALRNPLVSKSDWGQYTTRYRLISDGDELYHLAETLEVIPISVSV